VADGCRQVMEAGGHLPRPRADSCGDSSKSSILNGEPAVQELAKPEASL